MMLSDWIPVSTCCDPILVLSSICRYWWTWLHPPVGCLALVSVFCFKSQLLSMIIYGYISQIVDNMHFTVSALHLSRPNHWFKWRPLTICWDLSVYRVSDIPIATMDGDILRWYVVTIIFYHSRPNRVVKHDTYV